MNAERYVLDTSAILTLIEDKSGADRVQPILREGQVWLLCVVLLAATYITQQEQGESEANLGYALLKELPVTIGSEVDGPLLLTAARLWQSQGKTNEARDLFAPAYNWFTEGFDTADLKNALSEGEGK